MRIILRYNSNSAVWETTKLFKALYDAYNHGGPDSQFCKDVLNKRVVEGEAFDPHYFTGNLFYP